MTTYPAQRERSELCDLFVEVGPDAPTLCGDWTTRDLAAHLIVRERRPDAAVGILISQAAGYTDKVQRGVADGDWDDLVETVRTGPPLWSPTKLSAVDRAANTIEFFVHHEDVRRAGDEWEPRELDSDLNEALTTMVARLAKRLVRSSEVGVVLETPITSIVAKDAPRSVTVRGPVGEVVLFAYGRQDHSRVDLVGDEAAIDMVMEASFGL